jgi:3-hydroxyisobutyrate dehydrogenase-like beta-hydroxyacid dehydrogenase
MKRSLMRQTIGVLHPGAMGISVAASAQKSGHAVYWASEGRSMETRERAEAHSLREAHTLARLCNVCTIIMSICPPHAAEDVAEQVAAHGFSGFYLDANAISPERAKGIGQMMTRAGASFVDGGIIGGPAWEAGRTWLYLSGENADVIASCFAAGPLETKVIGGNIGDASALKMCFAAYSKGTTALLCAILATAEASGVREPLFEQWSRHGSDFAEQAAERVRQVTKKAWRFAGEMEEIAATFHDAGLPDGFHQAAAAVYRRIAHFKDAPTPPIEEVLAALVKTTEVTGDGISRDD